LHAHLAEAGLTHLADAVENSRIAVSGGDMQVITGKSYKLYFEDKQFSEAVRSVFGRPLRLQITLGEVPDAAPAQPAVKEEENDTTRRALAHPEVRRFQEVFGGEVRKVRNLKE
jgi:DNA polymerase-3 subunit gamma/tau